MEFTTYIRKPFSIDAVQITEDNMKDVAKLIGKIRTRDGVRYIAVDPRVVPVVRHAYVGWYLTRFEDSYRCYTPKLFKSQFVLFEDLNGGT